MNGALPPRSTPGVQIVRRVAHRWKNLFDLVLDVEQYPSFVPHCRRVELLSKAPSGSIEGQTGAGKVVVLSRMTVGISALRVSYANRTVGDRDRRRIDVDALDGPLRYLKVAWEFHPQADETTEIAFSASFAFSSPLLTAVASRLFDAIIAGMVTAFERRADVLFRPRSV
jgi:coenzyme Q-binding protein COQ10